ncbi:hypothetical protein EFL35_02835 [Weissella paramesenteroides]|nr:hypothetical protein [Weissella paramesenteroides]MCS9997744.1 hypothetical protein [Weissella paramesenteroides]MCT0259899.1 hypothetical protein [Weissella paramesenteroides]MCT0486145.1 hypothetical protein [Weissella paramesenteroides]
MIIKKRFKNFRNTLKVIKSPTSNWWIDDLFSLLITTYIPLLFMHKFAFFILYKKKLKNKCEKNVF